MLAVLAWKWNFIENGRGYKIANRSYTKPLRLDARRKNYNFDKLRFKYFYKCFIFSNKCMTHMI